MEIDHDNSFRSLLFIYGILFVVGIVVGLEIYKKLHKQPLTDVEAEDSFCKEYIRPWEVWNSINCIQDKKIAAVARNVLSEELLHLSAVTAANRCSIEKTKDFQKKNFTKPYYIFPEEKVTYMIKRKESILNLLRCHSHTYGSFELRKRTLVEFRKLVLQLISIHRIFTKIYKSLLRIKSYKHTTDVTYSDFVFPLTRFRAFTTINFLEMKRYLLSGLIAQGIIKAEILDNKKSMSFWKAFSLRYEKLTSDIINTFSTNRKEPIGQYSTNMSREDFLKYFEEFQLLLRHFTMNLQLMLMWCFSIEDHDNQGNSMFLDKRANFMLNQEDKRELKWEVLNIRIKTENLTVILNENHQIPHEYEIDEELNQSLIMKLQYDLIHRHLQAYIKLILGNLDKISVENLLEQWENGGNIGK